MALVIEVDEKQVSKQKAAAMLEMVGQMVIDGAFPVMAYFVDEKYDDWPGE